MNFKFKAILAWNMPKYIAHLQTDKPAALQVIFIQSNSSENSKIITRQKKRRKEKRLFLKVGAAKCSQISSLLYGNTSFKTAFKSGLRSPKESTN